MDQFDHELCCAVCNNNGMTISGGFKAILEEHLINKTEWAS